MRSWIVLMNVLAAVVNMENDNRSSGVPGRQAYQMPATLMMASSRRWILKGRFLGPSFFHSTNPLIMPGAGLCRMRHTT